MTRYTYGFSRDLDLPFVEAVERTTSALRAEGFTVTPLAHPANVASNGRGTQDYLVMDVCDPELLEQAVQVRPDFALQASCRAVVHSRGKGSTVCISDPYQSVGAATVPAIAGDLNGRLWSAYLRVVLEGDPLSHEPRSPCAPKRRSK